MQIHTVIVAKLVDKDLELEFFLVKECAAGCRLRHKYICGINLWSVLFGSHLKC